MVNVNRISKKSKQSNQITKDYQQQDWTINYILLSGVSLSYLPIKYFSHGIVTNVIRFGSKILRLNRDVSGRSRTEAEFRDEIGNTCNSFSVKCFILHYSEFHYFLINN